MCLSFFSFLFFSEIEATEACKWLRAAGFPQYAQMYEGMYENSPFRFYLNVSTKHKNLYSVNR